MYIVDQSIESFRVVQLFDIPNFEAIVALSETLFVSYWFFRKFKLLEKNNYTTTDDF